jgi:hypothetical protein
MIYDFMLALSTNANVFNDWANSDYELGSYAEHVEYLAEELADKYLEV